MTVLVFVGDLMFRSRIDGAARAAGVTLVYPRGGEDAAAAVTTAAPDLVLVDLALKSADAIAVITAVRAVTPARMVAFGSHVATDALAAARTAGADQVLPRSSFTATLPRCVPI